MALCLAARNRHSIVVMETNKSFISYIKQVQKWVAQGWRDGSHEALRGPDSCHASALMKEHT